MKDFTNYKKLMEDEVGNFKAQVNPTMNNSLNKGKDRITQFLEILSKVESHMDEYCKMHFKDEKLNKEELAELKSINKVIYDDFINYCKIPGLSKKDI
jgi:hypothetical protein